MKTNCRGSNQFKIRYKGLCKSAIHSIFKVAFTIIAIVALIQWYRYGVRLNYYHWRDTNVLSPCMNFCDFTGKVQAQGPTPTPPTDNSWPSVAKLIIDEFSPEGPQVTYEALTVAKGESGWRHNAYNWNTNNTADMCPFQINDVHILRFGTKYQSDVKECIKVAHLLYKEQKWNPWVYAHKIGLAD